MVGAAECCCVAVYLKLDPRSTGPSGIYVIYDTAPFLMVQLSMGVGKEVGRSVVAAKGK